MLRGLTTVTYWADDLAAAGDWYATLLGIEPYYEVKGPDGQAAYIEFRLGDYQHELGLVRSDYAPDGSGAGRAGPRIYWAVDDVPAALARLRELGAEEYEPPVDRGKGFVTASVVDPFGNVLAVMDNPHYRDILAGLRAG